ncbi:hypothetical protein [Microcoleus sp. FACHB-68]|uniref:hypothetical protein n=1 Tax=Microcoleus sp. FACHB-68 TaxID=2692826 RepID=UPI001685F3D0|nr:hypothetical protein [Microcoleus sp. FACHB-68]MBD1936175.1 hypothetical protein [Microcoleus sp. FACHB-68]
MLGPIMEFNRHQGGESPLQMPWEGSSTRPSRSRRICERTAYHCREEMEMTAQLEGLSERIASLESFRER